MNQQHDSTAPDEKATALLTIDHVRAAAARIARDEMGFEVVGMGCYNREQARLIRSLAKDYGVEALITDDYLEVERRIEEIRSGAAARASS